MLVSSSRREIYEVCAPIKPPFPPCSRPSSRARHWLRTRTRRRRHGSRYHTISTAYTSSTRHHSHRIRSRLYSATLDVHWKARSKFTYKAPLDVEWRKVINEYQGNVHKWPDVWLAKLLQNETRWKCSTYYELVQPPLLRCVYLTPGQDIHPPVP